MLKRQVKRPACMKIGEVIAHVLNHLIIYYTGIQTSTKNARCSEKVRKASRDMKQDGELFTGEVPLACTLTESEHITRKEEVSDLFKHVQEVNELADGYTLRFPGSDTWANTLLVDQGVTL